MARGDCERRNKGKDKRREKKKHPYKKGGIKRSQEIKKKK
jgi:hypothetical protein